MSIGFPEYSFEVKVVLVSRNEVTLVKDAALLYSLSSHADSQGCLHGSCGETCVAGCVWKQGLLHGDLCTFVGMLIV